MSFISYNFKYEYSTDLNYIYATEDMPDIRENVGTFRDFSAHEMKINFLDFETIELVDSISASTTPTCIRFVVNGFLLFYTLDNQTPLANPNSNGISPLLRYKLNWKLTFLRRFIMDNKSQVNYYYFKRSNRFKWDPRINTPCPMVEKLMENVTLRKVYVKSTLSTNKWTITKWDSYSVYIPCIMYYIFSKNGRFYLFPLLDGTESFTPGQAGMKVYYNNRIFNGNGRAANTRQHLESLASQWKTNGYIGKFFGLNLAAVSQDLGYMDSNNRNFDIETYGNDTFFGYKFSHSMYNNTGLNFDIGKSVNIGTVIDRTDNRYTFEHLRYINLGFFNNTFDLAKLYWCKFGSTVGASYASSTINCRILNADVKATGLYVTISNNGGVANYLHYVNPETATFHLSNQLPVPIDTYLTWSNDNATALNNNYIIKQITSSLSIVTGIITTALSAVATAATFGTASPLTTLTASSGVASIVSGIAGLGTNAVQHNTTFQQAAQKYKGNIVSGDGVDFAYYNYYIKYTDDNQGGTNGQIISNWNAQVYSVDYIDDNISQAITDIIFMFGYPGLRSERVQLFDRHSTSITFTYHEFDMNKSRELQKLITAFTSIVPKWLNTNNIYNYITKKLENGVRWWW